VALLKARSIVSVRLAFRLEELSPIIPDHALPEQSKGGAGVATFD